MIGELLGMALWWPRVAWFAARVGRRLARRSLPEFLAELTPPPGRSAWPRVRPESQARVIYNVLRWNVGPWRNGCFTRSFARYHFFRRLGVPVVFRIGIEETAPGRVTSAPPGEVPESFAHLRGHAWLTLDDAPYLEWEPARFTAYRPLYRYPAAATVDPAEAAT